MSTPHSSPLPLPQPNKPRSLWNTQGTWALFRLFTSPTDDSGGQEHTHIHIHTRTCTLAHTWSHPWHDERHSYRPVSLDLGCTSKSLRWFVQIMLMSGPNLGQIKSESFRMKPGQPLPRSTAVDTCTRTGVRNQHSPHPQYLPILQGTQWDWRIVATSAVATSKGHREKPWPQFRREWSRFITGWIT